MSILFRDRADAGRQLAAALREWKACNPVVVGLPRGGVVVAHEVATALHTPLEVCVARKLGATGNPELGIGAIAPGGVLLLDRIVIQELKISEPDLARQIADQTAEMQRRMRLYDDRRDPLSLRDRTVILVDDGMATGGTACAAVQSIRKQHPRTVLLAVPVCSTAAARQMRMQVDALVSLHEPPDFRAVGYFYESFDQTTDEEVLRILSGYPPVSP